MDIFKEAFTAFPWYVYVILMAGSLLVGVGIRRHMEKGKILRAKQEKIDRKEAKKEAKRQARLRKKRLARQK